MGDVLPVCDAMSADDNRTQKALPDRSVAEPAKRGQRGDAIREALGESGVGQFDTDSDTDTDTDQLADAAQANNRLADFCTFTN